MAFHSTYIFTPRCVFLYSAASVHVSRQLGQCAHRSRPAPLPLPHCRYTLASTAAEEALRENATLMATMQRMYAEVRCDEIWVDISLVLCVWTLQCNVWTSPRDDVLSETTRDTLPNSREALLRF